MVIVHIETGQEISVSHWGRRMNIVRRRTFAWAGALKEYLSQLGKGYRLLMITLTYKDPSQWQTNAINTYMRALRSKLAGSLLAYIWVAETQKRGAIHYHVLVLVKQGSRVPMPDKSGMWPWGHSNIQTARTPYYICKYVSKQFQKEGDLPKGARVCGANIKKGTLSSQEELEYKMACYPAWVRKEREFLITAGALEREDKIKREGSKWYACGVFRVEIASKWRLLGLSRKERPKKPEVREIIECLNLWRQRR